MSQITYFSVEKLAALAKQVRKQSKKTRAQAAREMNVSQTSIFHAEESPDQGLSKLRIRIIEKYSDYTVEGPVYILQRNLPA